MAEKIATRFVDTRTGDEYIVGTRGSEEKVQVVLRVPDTETDFTQYKVVVENISTSVVTEYQLDEFGTCTFTIPHGEIYSVSLPVIGDYVQPATATYNASLTSRPIEHNYIHEELKYEQVTIHASAMSETSPAELVDGLMVIARYDNGTVNVGTFDGSVCVITGIPYGTHYTLAMPDVAGHTHDHKSDSHIAGVQSREVAVMYTQALFGIWGRDIDGNDYTIDELEAMGTAAAADLIVAGCFNEPYLNSADREDGSGTGCGFMWSIANPSTSGQWATQNVEFDKARLPFITNEGMGLEKCAGKTYTEAIIEIGENMQVQTPAATSCYNRVFTIGGVDRNGFLPAYGQIRRLVLQRTMYERFYAALGKSAPTIWSGNWWTSCQNSAATGVYLANGGFGDYRKTFSHSVMVFYDL